ncbi:hypothetical protein EDD85DRAFT_960277 [Armillaria nabsnona]|nr:hypothetical protein EDD85DRAFT_960277 [Armillaria nabsnona]
MEELLSNWAVQRVVQFINKAFAAIHPELWKHYRRLLDDLTDAHPYLSRIFDCEHSVFALCTLNIGGMTTHRHRDHLNLGPGVCPIFAIGDFDHTKGGHLVVWDLKLVIEFPFRTLIFIPSALLEHSNVPIHEGETRYSFTQFSAAGLFRWVDNSYRSDKDLEEWGSWVESIAGNSSEPQEQVPRAQHELQRKYEQRYDASHCEVRQKKAVERMRVKCEAIKSLPPEEQDAIHAKNKVAQATYHKKHRAQLQHKAEMQHSINFMDLYADDIDAMPE